MLGDADPEERFLVGAVNASWRYCAGWPALHNATLLPTLIWSLPSSLLAQHWAHRKTCTAAHVLFAPFVTGMSLATTLGVTQERLQEVLGSLFGGLQI